MLGWTVGITLVCLNRWPLTNTQDSSVSHTRAPAALTKISKQHRLAAAQDMDAGGLRVCVSDSGRECVFVFVLSNPLHLSHGSASRPDTNGTISHQTLPKHELEPQEAPMTDAGTRSIMVSTRLRQNHWKQPMYKMKSTLIINVAKSPVVVMTSG